MLFHKENRVHKTHTSTRYINDDEVVNVKKLPEIYKNRENCCGCSACYASCPVKAITMEPDEEGFLYPMVNSNKCVRCYKCLSVCAFKKEQRTRGYCGF
ncbi:MAG: 4Fe-4S dicluster domain-containing protein [Lachnospiraceae bacterium]